MTLTIPIAGMVLDGCVLAILKEGDTYGYDLTQHLQKQIEISESTLYPVLRRLQKEDYLETYDIPHSGRNRRYYKLTPLGLQRLEATKVAWEVYKNQVGGLLRTDISIPEMLLDGGPRND